MRITTKGQLTIPLAIRKKHGLLGECAVAFVDHADGVLVVRADKRRPGKRALANLMRGRRIKTRTQDWLRLTRGDE